MSKLKKQNFLLVLKSCPSWKKTNVFKHFQSISDVCSRLFWVFKRLTNVFQSIFFFAQKRSRVNGIWILSQLSSFSIRISTFEPPLCSICHKLMCTFLVDCLFVSISFYDPSATIKMSRILILKVLFVWMEKKNLVSVWTEYRLWKFWKLFDSL